jgi:transposase
MKNETTKLVCTLSNKQIKAQFKLLVFNGRPRCPRCGYTKVRCSENRYRCPKCRRPFSLTSGTWLANMKLPWDKLYLLLDGWLKRMSLDLITTYVNISYPTAFDWYRSFRTNVPRAAFKMSDSGHYVIDESYFGFKKKGKRGRGAQGKKPFFGIYEPDEDKMITELVSNVDEENLLPIIKEHIPLGATIVSDGWQAYNHLEENGYRHIVVNHEQNEYHALSNPIEAAWSHQKRNFRKMYHHCKIKNLSEYGREICYRFCARHKPDSPLTFLQKTISRVPTCLH